MLGNTRLKFGISRAVVIDRAFYARLLSNRCQDLNTVRRRGNNVVLLHFGDPIAISQYYPFIRYRDEVSRRYGLSVAHIDTDDYSEMAPTVNPAVKLVCLQTWFDLKKADTQALLDRISADFPNARVVYYDWFAPVDLRMVERLDDRVDLYVKKNLLKDRSFYGTRHAGDTNLSHYYGSLYELDQPHQQFEVAERWWERIMVGPGFICSPYIEQLTTLPRKLLGDDVRVLDIQSRVGGTGDAGWYGHSRRHANSLVQNLENLKVAPSGRVSLRRYLLEVAQAKLTFSPFGYGEVCWRDYEAFALGSVLIKPCMAHLTCTPELFLGDETYVPVKWDFSDFNERIEECLDRPDWLQSMRERAHGICADYVSGRRSVEFVGRMLAQLQLDG